MNDHRAELKRITEILLSPEDNYGVLTPVIQDLYQLFLSVSKIEAGPPQYQEHIYLPIGKAIGPYWAGLCIHEILRTKRFITGVYLGLKAAMARFPGVPIHCLYAGTGPFATLAMPMTVLFTSDQVKFTLIEINPYNIEPLERIIHGFGAEDYVIGIVQEDATQFQPDPAKPFQMIITETMQNALQNEPQVAITMNLASQMEPGGILIPQNIEIEAALLSPKRNQDRMMGIIGAEACYRSLGKICSLNDEICRVTPNPDPTNADCYTFPEVEVAIPPDWVAEYPDVCLLTRIQVFGETELKAWECSLTVPQKVLHLDPVKPPARIALRYWINEKPGFRYRIEKNSV
jgi:hypothetical protein